MAASWLENAAAHWPEWVAVGVSALVYLLIDLGLQVKSMRALFRTVRFYILLVAFIALNLVSYGFVRVAWGAKMDKMVGTTSLLAIILISTLGTLGLLQSLTVKLGGQKFLNVEKMLDAYRAKVLSDAGQKDIDLQKRDTDRLANKLVRKYENDAAQLRIEFYQVMKWSNRSDDDIAGDLEGMQATAARLGAAGVERLIAERMAKTDPVRVKAILDR
jgi:hypothetical protein